VIKLLDETKVQSALAETYLFYEKEFKLNGLKAIGSLIRELKKVSIKKREDISFDTSNKKN
jgi:hypothetical protein